MGKNGTKGTCEKNREKIGGLSGQNFYLRISGCDFFWGNDPTMKDALVGFCGCLKMRKVLVSRMTPMMQVTAMIHGSFSFRSVNP